MSGNNPRTTGWDAANTTTFNTTVNFPDYWSQYQNAPQPQPDGMQFYPNPPSEDKENKTIEGVEMKELYDVYMVYAEDRKNPVIEIKRGVIASDEEDAKIKSGLMKKIDEDWDADYLTFICYEIGSVSVKEKPKEVKQI